MLFKETELACLQFNPFDLIGKDWFLLTAGDEFGYNAMTASWGGVGFIWRKNVFTCVVRPTRHTFSFIENADTYSICFFEESYRSALQFCGTKSGREFDKAKETGLTPCFIDGTTVFEEAKLVFVCKKLYAQPLDESAFVDKSLLELYDGEAFHKTYVGEIIKAYTKD